MNNRSKTAAYNDFVEMIMNSWIWQRMTDSEKNRFIDEIMDHPSMTAKGTYKARWEFYQALYHAYLSGLGYTGTGWRDDLVTVWTVKHHD